MASGFEILISSLADGATICTLPDVDGYPACIQHGDEATSWRRGNDIGGVEELPFWEPGSLARVCPTSASATTRLADILQVPESATTCVLACVNPLSAV